MAGSFFTLPTMSAASRADQLVQPSPRPRRYRARALQDHVGNLSLAVADMGVQPDGERLGHGSGARPLGARDERDAKACPRRHARKDHRRLPQGLAARPAMAIRAVAADEARAGGRVSRVVARIVEPDRLLPEAMALARRIAANPPCALRLSKRLISEGWSATSRQTLKLADACQGASRQTRDHAEAVAAILEKRKPALTA